jgi:hypothetical protein
VDPSAASSTAPPVARTRALPARVRALGLLALLGALVAFAGVFGAPRAASATVAGPVACQARAGAATLAVVVDFGGGRVRTRCTEPGGTGVDVLRRAGFGPVTQSYGTVGGDAAVCAILDPDTQTLQGCQSGSSCLTCLAPDAWGYFPAYRYSQIGAGDTQPGAGTVEAWRWGRSTSWGGTKPSVADVCDEPDPEPPATTPPTTTRPSGGGNGGGGNGGGGTADPFPGDPGPGGGGPSDPTDPASPGPGGASSTTTPGASSTTAPGATTDGATTTETAEGADERVDRSETDDADDADRGDQRADGLLGAPPDDPAGGGGGGTPVVPFVVTALVVAAVAALALRARRARAA